VARVQSIVCDGCGKVKGETNHWYMVSNIDDEFVLTRWIEADQDSYSVSHLCGQACVISKLSEWMNPKKEAVTTPTLTEAYEKLHKPGIANATQEAYYIEPRCPRCPHPVERHRQFSAAMGSVCELCDCQWLPPLDK
jgi:hypothetical protein